MATVITYSSLTTSQRDSQIQLDTRYGCICLQFRLVDHIGFIKHLCPYVAIACIFDYTAGCWKIAAIVTMLEQRKRKQWTSM